MSEVVKEGDTVIILGLGGIAVGAQSVLADGVNSACIRLSRSKITRDIGQQITNEESEFLEESTHLIFLNRESLDVVSRAVEYCRGVFDLIDEDNLKL